MAKIGKIYRQTMRRWTWLLYRKRNILNAKLDSFMRDNVRLYIGCGDKKLAGYVNIDIVPTEGADLVMDVSRELHLIGSNIASEVRLESVFEHFYRYQQRKILQEFFRIMKQGGRLIIKRLPDFDVIIEAYLNKANVGIDEQFDLFNVYRFTHGEPTPKNSPQQLHKDIFTKQSIRTLLEDTGFQVVSIENEIFPGEKLALNINITAIKA